jgi:CheY-like chemotaxis protein
MSLETEAIELGGQVERCVQTVMSGKPEAAAQLELRLEPVWLEADPARIQQIVANLVDNALRHTPPGRRIRITVGLKGAEAELRVADEGEGIEPSLLPRVFEPFSQGAQGPGRERGGLGIGLTLVRRLVELHHGTVEARSAGPGQGSEFIVRLPLGKPRDTRAAGRVPAGRRGCSRVLIIEDNVDARSALRAWLEAAGHEDHEAADGERGVSSAAALEPDVALVDIGLPLMDGYEVARRLRAANGRLRLVALTGHGQDEDRRRALEAGFDAHLVKPVDLERLAAVIDELAR